MCLRGVLSLGEGALSAGDNPPGLQLKPEVGQGCDGNGGGGGVCRTFSQCFRGFRLHLTYNSASLR